MSSERYNPTADGQAVTLTHLQKMGTAAAHADDYVLAELLKLRQKTGGVVDRVVLPFEQRGVNTPFVGPSIATGFPLQIMPFRAVLGPRVVATDVAGPDVLLSTAQEQSYRDTRSAVFAQWNNGTSSTVAAFGVPQASIPANVDPSNARIDLIYATLYVDAPSATQTIPVKPAAGGAAVPQTFSATLVTGVGSPPGSANGIGVVTGSPGLPPALPTTPADVPGVSYVFPLAYVVIPHGYTVGGAIAQNQINIVSSIGSIGEMLGAPAVRPASSISGAGAMSLQTPGSANNVWGGAIGRPPNALSSTMRGGKTLIWQVDAKQAAGSAGSLRNGATVDDLIDWRKRYFLTMAQVLAGGVSFASDAAGGGAMIPGVNGLSSPSPVWQTGQSMRDDSAANSNPATTGGVVLLNQSVFASMGAVSAITLYVDLTSGILKMGYQGTPGVLAVFWIFASGADGEW